MIDKMMIIVIYVISVYNTIKYFNEIYELTNL